MQHKHIYAKYGGKGGKIPLKKDSKKKKLLPSTFNITNMTVS